RHRQGWDEIVEFLGYGSFFILFPERSKRGLKHRSKPGPKLRAIRQQCGLSFREVYAASLGIARKHRQPAFVISPSLLNSPDLM
ncbi:MAG TPA: hypothetical protein VGU64_02665, partial [Terriglobales bacterium]|nr:hypothetical protein [Terriglobales bacterium]